MHLIASPTSSKVQPGFSAVIDQGVLSFSYFKYIRRSRANQGQIIMRGKRGSIKVAQLPWSSMWSKASFLGGACLNYIFIPNHDGGSDHSWQRTSFFLFPNQCLFENLSLRDYRPQKGSNDRFIYTSAQTWNASTQFSWKPCFLLADFGALYSRYGFWVLTWVFSLYYPSLTEINIVQ